MLDRIISHIVQEEVEKKFRTYGIGDFDKDKFRKIRNWWYQRNKPYGGLWASPVDTENGWIEWCNNERYGSYEGDDYFEFTLKPDARVYTIETMQDIVNLPMQTKTPVLGRPVDNSTIWKYPDFEEIAKQWDVIEFFCNGETYDPLYGWDCDSILVLNPDVVEVTKHNDVPAKERGRHEYMPKHIADSAGVDWNEMEKINNNVKESRIRDIVRESINKMIQEKSGIHIDPKNKGKFNATKKRTGKSTSELAHSKNPLTRKRAVFAMNAKKWNHNKK